MTFFKHILPATLLAVLFTLGAYAQSAMTGTAPVTETETITQTTAPTWETESRYWSSNYPLRPYYKKTTTYMTYEPAYRYGFDAYTQYKGEQYDAVSDAQLKAGWEKARGTSTTMTWEDARPAVRDSYNRLYDYYRSSAQTTHIEPTND